MSSPSDSSESECNSDNYITSDYTESEEESEVELKAISTFQFLTPHQKF